jgi:YD repeat-containing protein
MSNPPDAQAIAQALDGVAAHGDDRTIRTSYDRLGRVVQVTEPQVWVSDGLQGMFASKITRNIYNAFGQLQQQAVLADAANDAWAISTNYYDRDGRNIGTSDPMGYVTVRAFDAAGNVTRVTEYANASVPGTAELALPNESGDDRTTVYAYDAANRLTGETRLHVQFSDGTDDVANGTRSYGDVVTRYEYDAAGNRTATVDALGGRTYAAYDALGRVTSVSRPAVAGLDGPLQPLTVYQRDALGNVVATIAYANGINGAAGSAGADDRISLAQYDSAGNATQVTDANGVSHFQSYDAGKHLRKQWQGVSGSDGQEHTLFTAYEYDAAGRVTATITPGSNVVFDAAAGTMRTVDQSTVAAVRSDISYNAFGDIVRQGVEGGQQTSFSYDRAGRLWRSTSGNRQRRHGVQRLVRRRRPAAGHCRRGPGGSAARPAPHRHGARPARTRDRDCAARARRRAARGAPDVRPLGQHAEPKHAERCRQRQRLPLQRQQPGHQHQRARWERPAKRVQPRHAVLL